MVKNIKQKMAPGPKGLTIKRQKQMATGKDDVLG